MRILLLSAYAAHSHTYWQHWLTSEFPDWAWTVLSLPPRHFSWRVRGNPLYWSVTERDTLSVHYDLVLATSMVDLATLRGLVPPLSRLPAVLYFHENQFAYPRQSHANSLLEAQMVSLYSALAADRLLFNSQYNRESFLVGCDSLLSRLPDYVPANVTAMLDAKAAVLPVPVDTASVEACAPAWPAAISADAVRLVWTGRFEYDKGADRLYTVLEALEQTGLQYQLALTGPRFRSMPDVFERIQSRFAHRLVHFGYIPCREAYLSLLRGAQIVLSTALHEFQGLAVMEAVTAGCVPVVPDRLAYRELYPEAFRYASCPDLHAEAAAAAGLILRQAQALRAGDCPLPPLSSYTRAQLAPRYRAALQSL
ncbi:MAG: DUF3524 domain-containing protein [Halioglobus sp.]|nr:DUF3524 domain-containing protein [Halioglobus sp.]